MKKNNKKKKYIFIVGALAVALLCFIGKTNSWFYNGKTIRTATSLISPYTLRIGAGNNETIEQLYLGDIDVTTEEKYKYYVFCVYGNPSIPYMVQLAHTTNTGLQYEVYYAGEPTLTEPLVDQNSYAKYSAIDKNTYYFEIKNANEVRGTNATSNLLMNSDNYINEQNGIANGNYKFKDSVDDVVNRGSYDSSDKVQKNAEALYMQSDIVYPTDDENNFGEFVHYYVLKVLWDEKIKNNKETDIIYVTVSAK